MKKLFISAVLATAMIFGANAQHFWVGGAVGFESSSFREADSDNFSSRSAFSISPEVGFSLNNRFDVGLGFSFGTERQQHYFSSQWWTNEFDERAFSWSIAPFVQYTVFEFGRLRLLCRATVGFESHTGFEIWDGEIEFTGNDEDRLSGFGANITPFVHYVISDRFNVFASLNFLSLNFARVSEKFDGNDIGTVTVFNFGVDSNNLFNTGNFQIGFIFKF